MPLAESHSLPHKKDRKPKKLVSNNKKTVPRHKEYYEAEAILDQLYCDLCNGASKSDVMQKLMGGNYGKVMKHRNASDYYNTAMKRLEYNADIKAEELRDLLYNRYETILEECMKNGDMFNARVTLDSIAKVFLGVGKKENNIQINNNADGITIKFGFSNEKEENNTVEGEYEET